MSAEQAVRIAVTEALEGAAALAGAVNGIRFGSRGRSTAPHVTVGDIVATDWSTKDRPGREMRCSVIIRDAGDSPARLEELMALAGEAIEGMARDLPGWQIASLVFLRSRTGREGTSGWIGTLEYRARALGR